MFLPSHTQPRDFCISAGKVQDCQMWTELPPLLYTSTSLDLHEGPPTNLALAHPASLRGCTLQRPSFLCGHRMGLPWRTALRLMWHMPQCSTSLEQESLPGPHMMDAVPSSHSARELAVADMRTESYIWSPGTARGKSCLDCCASLQDCSSLPSIPTPPGRAPNKYAGLALAR